MAQKQIHLNNITIGDQSPLFLIAEIGINHNGDMQITKKLMDAAFATNWHCVKFQKRTPDICVPDHQKNVMRDTPWGQMTYLDYRYKVEFNDENYAYIDRYCKEKPLFWTASVWDIPSIEFLMRFDIPFIKIPSAKLTETGLVIEACKTGKPIFLSTGMSTIEEIDKAVEILETHTNGRYVLFYTNSSYPTPVEDLNLMMIQTLKNRYQCLIGYSGHEYDLEPSVIAASLGICVLERHVTINHTMWGSDQFASLEVHAMDLLQKRIKDIPILMGDGIKKLTPKELEVRKKLRGC